MDKNLRNRLPKEKLIRLYGVKGCSLGDIARMYGVSRVAIMKYCNILGVGRRTKGEARILAQKKGKIAGQHYHAINETFFSSWSPEMAYVLGLLMTDGFLNKPKNNSYRIYLCLNDKELLDKVAKAMSSEHNIAASKHQKGLYIYTFAREKMAQDLIRLGMKLNKSLNLEFPDVPKEYLRDFIRGVFDGDGSVYYSKKSENSPLQCKFYSGSESFITGLKGALESLGMPEKRLYSEKGKRQNPYYYIRYCHKDCLKLFKIMYEGLESDLYLKRKYDRFVAVINKVVEEKRGNCFAGLKAG